MRSTTVGWLTSILRVLPVTADHKWLNRARPAFCDNINHPTEPTDSTPRNSPMTRANTTAAEDRAGLGEWGSASGSRGILQGYHLGTRQVDPVHQSPQTRMYGFFTSSLSVTPYGPAYLSRVAS